MKKIALTIICGLAVTGAAFAQGTINWSTASTSITAQTNTEVYSPLFGGGTTGGGTIGNTANGATSGLHYDYELLYSSFNGTITTDTSVWDSNWYDAGLSATNSFTASRLAPINGSGAATVPWAGGTTNNIVLVGWSSNLGTSWAIVSAELANWQTDQGNFSGQAVLFGESNFGYINPNVAPAAGAVVFNTAATANGLPIFSLNTQLYLLPTPEPASLALVGLGGLSMLLFRRRK